MRRNFAVELDDRIVQHAKAALLRRPAEPNRHLQDAGVAQGLNEAKLLYEEILKSQLEDDE